MDMQLNQKLIKSQRLKRAWSQSQLAEISGLSLRTIQRIEKLGQASLESARSLAAVFETPVSELEAHQKSVFRLWPLPVIMATVLGVLFFLPATADNIMLNVLMSKDGQPLADVQLLNKQDQESEVRLGNDLKLTFLSQVTENGLILITVNVYERQGEAMELVAKPAIMTENKRAAEIHLDGLSLSLVATL